MTTELRPCCDCGGQPKYVVTNNGWTHSYDCSGCGLGVPVRAKTREEGEPRARELWNQSMEQLGRAENPWAERRTPGGPEGAS